MNTTPPNRLLIAILLALVTTVFARQDFYELEQINTGQGLSHQQVNSLVQDRYGFLWIGTPDGLDRFDGMQWQHFTSQPFDSTALSANFNTVLYEDRQGTLWAGTSFGLNRFDHASETFRRYLHDPGDSTSLSDNWISALLEDSQGRFWIGTARSGLNLFDRISGTSERLVKIPGDPGSLNDDHVTLIHEDELGGIWVATARGGLQRLDPAHDRFSTLPSHHPRIKHLFRRYLPELDSLVDSLRNSRSPLASIEHTGDAEQRVAEFDLAEPTQVLVIAAGEAVRDPMADHGWLERANQPPPVWRMTMAGSRHAGGAVKNRQSLEVVSLPPGRYSLHYLTDSSHSALRWNAAPPEPRIPWGIAVLPLTASESRIVMALLADTYLPSALSHPVVTAIANDPRPGKAGLWIGTLNGLNHFDLQTETFRYFPAQAFAEAGNEANPILSLLADGETQLKIGTSAGLLDFDLDQEEFRANRLLLGDRRSQPVQMVKRILRDRGGVLWLGTESQGLIKLRRSRFERVSRLAPEEPLGSVNAFCRDRFGVLWIGTDNNLYAVDSTFTRWLRIRLGSGVGANLHGSRVVFVHEDRAGSLWVGTWQGGLHRLQRGRGQINEHLSGPSGVPSSERRDESAIGVEFAHYSARPNDPRGLASDLLTSAGEDEQGRLWLGTEGAGLNRFDPQQQIFEHFRHDPDEPNSLPSNSVFHLIIDSHGILWIGTIHGGLSRFDPDHGEFTNFSYDAGDTTSLSNATVTFLHESIHPSSRTLWIGTYSGGLAALDLTAGGNTRFEHFTIRDGLPSNRIQGILEDGEGSLWLSTNRGVARFDPAGLRFTCFDRQDGLQSDFFGMRSCYRDRDGSLLMGGTKGFNRIKPDRVWTNDRIPEVRLTRFTRHGRVIRFLQPVAALEEIRLDHDENSFSFEFAVLDYHNPANNQYAYRFEGLDSDWIHCGSRRYANYTDVSPGEYVFRVKGANSDGVWNAAGTAVRVIISPPWWQTWPFRLAMFMVVAGSILLLHRYRIRRAVQTEHEKNRAVDRLRQEIAANFHDESGHKIAKISILSALIRQKLNGQRNGVTEELQKIVTATAGLQQDLSDFIWTLDPKNDSLYEMALNLKDFGEELFDHTGIRFETEGISADLEQVDLPMNWRRNLARVFKEAMTNAMRHADGSRVLLSFQLRPASVVISLHDDGRGFELAAGRKTDRGGHGLRNMQRRAAEMNGELTISSKPQRGTIITFTGVRPAI